MGSIGQLKVSLFKPASVMPTNPIPKGTKNLTVNVPAELHQEMQSLASASSMKLSQYVRGLLLMARDQKVKVEPDYLDLKRSEKVDRAD